MRGLVLALLVASASAAPLGYDQNSYNWDGTLQAPGGVRALDESRTESELGESQMKGAGKAELDHQVIAMYEQHRWGWPGKESPEMQVPGSWRGDHEIGESMEEAEQEEQKEQMDPNAPVNPLAAKAAHDPNAGRQTKKAVEKKYEKQYDKAIAARNAERNDFVSAPGNNILVASQQGKRAVHDVSRDRAATAAQEKHDAKTVTPSEAAAEMDALAMKVPRVAEDKAKSKYDSKKYKPGKGISTKQGAIKKGPHHDIEVFDLDKVKAGQTVSGHRAFKHNLLDDNIPPKKLAQMRAAKKAAAKNAPAPPAPGAVNVKALEAKWSKQAEQAKMAKDMALDKKGLKKEHQPAAVHGQKKAAPKAAPKPPVQNKIVAAKTRQATTGKMVTPEEAEKKLMKIERSAELQGHAFNSPDQVPSSKNIVPKHTGAGYARAHPDE